MSFNLLSSISKIFKTGKLPPAEVVRVYTPDLSCFKYFVFSYYRDWCSNFSEHHSIYPISFRLFWFWFSSYARAYQLASYYEYYRLLDYDIGTFTPNKVNHLFARTIPESLFRALAYFLAPRMTPDGLVLIPTPNFYFLSSLTYHPKETVYARTLLCKPNPLLTRYHIYDFTSLNARMLFLLKGKAKVVHGIKPVLYKIIKATWYVRTVPDISTAVTSKPKFDSINGIVVTVMSESPRSISRKVEEYQGLRRVFLSSPSKLNKFDNSDKGRFLKKWGKYYDSDVDEFIFDEVVPPPVTDNVREIHYYDSKEFANLEFERLCRPLTISVEYKIDSDDFEDLRSSSFSFMGLVPFRKPQYYYGSQLVFMFDRSTSIRKARPFAESYGTLLITNGQNGFNLEIPKVT